jgi:precorrin-6Y C5,15-methyltransferase (decarboxylating)
MNDSTNRKAIPRCRIIGVLDDGKASLSEIALQHLAQADVVIGAERTLVLFDDVMSAQAIRRPLKGADCRTGIYTCRFG